MSRGFYSSLGLLTAALGGIAGSSSAQAPARADEAQILFLKIPTVQGASRFDQIASEAPASVTVVTADEISRHGWRTLGEIVNSVRGFFTTYDRAYTYVAARGFGRPSDYSNRLLLLLDGRPVNDPIYGGGAYGTESLVDPQEIDRVEFIRGPGSSLYGASAFFGVINVITRRGRDLAGGRFKAIAGSFGTRALQSTYGKRFTSGIELLASGQVYRQNGQSLYYPEFADTHQGVAEFDRDEREHLLLKLSAGDFTLEGAYNDRRKQVPTGSYGTLFDNPRYAVEDEYGLLAASWQRSSSDGRRVTASAGFHSYDYNGGFPQADGFYGDRARGRWLGGDASLLRPLGAKQKLILGGEYRLSLAQEQLSWQEGDPASALGDSTRTDIYALFVEDELRFGRLILNAGLRFDHYTTFGSVLSPRAAAVYAWPGGAAKLLYGRAFRAPSNFELFYQDGYSVKANPTLDPEHIATIEAVLEQQIGKVLRGTLSLYQYRSTDLISQVKDSDGMLAYRNADRVQGRGAEAELEFDAPFLQGRLSYALQRARYSVTGSRLTNSPSHLVQASLSRALIRDHLTAGLTLLGMSARSAPSGATSSGFVTANVMLRGRRLLGGLGGSVGVYNLWNMVRNDPVGEEHVQPLLRLDGRELRLAFSFEF